MLLRDRVREAMARSGLTQARLAARAGADRSTVSALLGGTLPRLPNAQLVAELAAALEVSADWLLGLSDTPDSIGEILSRSLQVRAASHDPVDAQIERWHAEAHGLKIRNVPASLPAIVKTEAVIAAEYGAIERRASTAIPVGMNGGTSGETSAGPAAPSTDGADLARRMAGNDLELALPRQRLEGLAAREGLWRTLSRKDVEAQLARLAELHATLYPRVRIHLYDAARQYSAPITVFGAHRAVVYLGRSYFAFTTREHIVELTAQFDLLIRDAVVESHAFGEWLSALEPR